MASNRRNMTLPNMLNIYMIYKSQTWQYTCFIHNQKISAQLYIVITTAAVGQKYTNQKSYKSKMKIFLMIRATNELNFQGTHLAVVLAVTPKELECLWDKRVQNWSYWWYGVYNICTIPNSTPTKWNHDRYGWSTSRSKRDNTIGSWQLSMTLIWCLTVHSPNCVRPAIYSIWLSLICTFISHI